MSNYRKFWLQVGDNKYDLTTKDTFLTEINGLGFTKSYSSVTIGTKEIIQEEFYNLPTISGEICFINGTTPEKYRQYQDFLSFIRYSDAKLYYQTPNTFESYYCEGTVVSVEKGEVNSNGLLRCPFQFKATSQWQNSTKRIVTTTKSLVDGGKFYDLQRDYFYPTSTFDSIELTNRGYENVGFELLIDGNCTNPKLTLSQNGVIYGALQINGNYDKVYIVSKDGEENIVLEKDGSVIPNPISYQNMSIADGTIDVTFLKLRTGTTIASFSPNDFDGEVTISWYDAYMSV